MYLNVDDCIVVFELFCHADSCVSMMTCMLTLYFHMPPHSRWVSYFTNTNFLRCFLCYVVTAWGLTLSVLAERIGYQQIAVVSASDGYQDHQRFFLDQRGLLSHGPSQLNYRVQCQTHYCKWQSAKFSYMPVAYQLDIGYDKRFQSHVLARQQPFFGVAFSYPNTWTSSPQSRSPWQPWLGLIMPRSGMLELKDPTGTIQQNTLTSGSHLLHSYDLPTGAYPIDVSLTDQNGETETIQQFVNNTDLAQVHASGATRLMLGLPTNQAAASSYGLPPIDTHLQALMLNLSHRHQTRFGATQSTINVQKQQLALGFNTLFSMGRVYMQPEVLWLQSLASSTPRQSMAAGFNAQGLLGAHAQWRLLATTYPKKQSDDDLPWIAHGQLQWLHHDWLAGVTSHFSDRQSKRYVQALIRRQFKHRPMQPTVSVSARVFEQGTPTFSLIFNAKEKTPVAWSSRLTNSQQSITAVVKPQAKAQLALGAVNTTSTHPHRQRLVIHAHWQDALARWRASSVLPLDHQHATWSIQARTGMICSPQAALWTVLSSIDTPAIIDMNTSQSHGMIYWGDRMALCEQGIALHKKRPYSHVSQAVSSRDTILYPGNVHVTMLPPSTHGAKSQD